MCMSWSSEQIHILDNQGLSEDYALYESIGLQAMDEARILDVGCSDGYGTYRRFAPYSNIASVVGLDSDAASIEQAQKFYTDERFHFETCPFEDYPEDKRFDLICFYHTLQHLKDKEEVLAKVYRLLSPGGFIVVKAADDEAKISYPDPDAVMRRFFAAYERYVLPNTPWTSNTDRYFGHKSYSFLHHAGFRNIKVEQIVTDTTGMSCEERLNLYERVSYFRTKIPPETDDGTAEDIRSLAEGFRNLFKKEDYYFSQTTFYVVGQRIEEGVEPARYYDVLGKAQTGSAISVEGDASFYSEGVHQEQGSYRIRSMRESDIARVMPIELESFPSPWTPLAYAMELRYNNQAVYQVLEDEGGSLIGYTGVWHSRGNCSVLRIAVDDRYRKQGWGAVLLDNIITCAQKDGCTTVSLEVRVSNEKAISFYKGKGFTSSHLIKDFYTDPDEDALSMAKPL